MVLVTKADLIPAPTSVRLGTRSLSLGYGDTVVVSNLTVQFADGKITSLVGRNGSGKSTLLRAMGRLLRPLSGTVVLDGVPIQSLSTREVARRLAMLPQGPTAPEGLTVRELVEHGRYPYRNFLGLRSDDDRRAVDAALSAAGMQSFARRPLETLSGGQLQRAWIAMALAQDTDLMLLDEPTTFLDVAFQLELMELLHRLNREFGRTIVMVLHDLNQAARYSDQLIAIRDGQVYAAGRPEEVFTKEMIRDVFGIETDVAFDPRSKAPYCVPYALAADSEASREGYIASELADDSASSPSSRRSTNAGA
jgi:iron complex transport system ATP-binding protein